MSESSKKNWDDYIIKAFMDNFWKVKGKIRLKEKFEQQGKGGTSK